MKDEGIFFFFFYKSEGGLVKTCDYNAIMFALALTIEQDALKV